MADDKTPYFFWRDGRPRWIPGPKVRAEGFKGQDLKDAAGAWLPKRKAQEMADALNAAVAARREGRPQMAAIPAAATSTDRSVIALVDLFLARPKVSLDEKIAEAAVEKRRKKKLARSSRLAYHAHGKLLKDWMGEAAAAAITPAMIEDHYADLIEAKSIVSANAIMRSYRSIFIYGEKKLRWPGVQNPLAALEMDEAEGRLMMWPRTAIACYVAVADHLGWPSLGDAVIVALLTTQRRNDVLPVRARPLDNETIYRFLQSKTGREAKVKAVAMLLDRVRELRARKAERWGADGAHMETEIVCEATGLPYPPDGAYFGKRFRAVKLIAAGGNGNAEDMADALSLLGVTAEKVAAMPIARMPILNDLWFRDLRDTAVTWLAAAACDRYEISTVTGLSLKSVDAILDKHYLVRDDAFAISAGDKLASYLAKGA